MSGEPRVRRDVDWVLIGATLALGVIGIAFVHSASGAPDGLAPEATRQAVYLLVSVAVGAVLVRIDYRRLAERASWLYGAGIVLLLAVLAVGTQVGGNQSWLRLGPFSVQPSELMKVATVLMLAHVVHRTLGSRLRLRDALVQGLVVAVPVGLVILQPDVGTALTFLPLLGASIFAAGLRWRWIIALLVVMIALAPVGWNLLEPYQKRRVQVVINPDLDPTGDGYQAIQARITVGSGGLFGRGFAQGPQNRNGFLPERHTDFVYAIVAEEWGFLGAVLVLGLYAVVIRRLCDAAVLARDRLGSFTCLGAMVLVSVHVLVNAGMVLGLLPTIGIPLPLLSFGGTSVLATCCLIALAINVRMRRFAP